MSEAVLSIVNLTVSLPSWADRPHAVDGVEIFLAAGRRRIDEPAVAGCIEIDGQHAGVAIAEFIAIEIPDGNARGADPGHLLGVKSAGRLPDLLGGGQQRFGFTQ